MDLLRDSNLAQLTRRFLDTTIAADGARIIDATPEKDLAIVLRSHWLHPPTSINVRKREAVDWLIAYYSVLEVASIAGCVPQTMPNELHRVAVRRLSRPNVVRYYTRYYPLLLPQLFLKRLQNDGAVESVDAYPEFVRFLHLAQRNDDALETFFWLLDDKTVNGYNLRDVLAAFADTKRLLKVLTSSREKTHPLDRAVRGLLSFLQFSRELDALLQSCHSKPVLQSAFWHYHGYWFQQLGPQVAGIISAVIEGYRDSVGSGRTTLEKKRIQATHADMDQAQRSMHRLTSAIYSAILDRRMLGDGIDDQRPTQLRVGNDPNQSPIRKTSSGLAQHEAAPPPSVEAKAADVTTSRDLQVGPPLFSQSGKSPGGKSKGQRLATKTPKCEYAR